MVRLAGGPATSGSHNAPAFWEPNRLFQERGCSLFLIKQALQSLFALGGSGKYKKK